MTSLVAAGTAHLRSDVLEQMVKLAYEAGEKIMRVYASPFEVEMKGANDPVTIADREANEWIVAGLSHFGLPIVAEESDPAIYAAYATEPAAFFVDPLDGTREFVAKNGEFAVMIGLAEFGVATAGVIHCPVAARTIVGSVDGQAYELTGPGERTDLKVEEPHGRPRILVSRSHRTAELERWLEIVESSTEARGSAGYKAMMVATSQAHAYVYVGGAGSRWDACAPEAILRAAGARVTDQCGRPFDYNGRDLKNRDGFVAAPPSLHDVLLGSLARALG
jgi:3'(2'), 5'-bisphosphate nucleotidase